MLIYFSNSIFSDIILFFNLYKILDHPVYSFETIGTRATREDISNFGGKFFFNEVYF